MDILIGVEMVHLFNLLPTDHQVLKHQIPDGPSCSTDFYF